MSQSNQFIHRLERLDDGDRWRLRRLAGQSLDATLLGFDLFTGLWWPLRAQSPTTPRRDTSWLVAKLYGSFRIPHVRTGPEHDTTLPCILGRCEPSDERDATRFRRRFDALICSPLAALEPHLRWALDQIDTDTAGRTQRMQGFSGLDWVQLLDDLSIWDRGQEHRRKRDIRDIWANQYLNAVRWPIGAAHVS